MKKAAIVFLSAVLALSLAGCSKETPGGSIEDPEDSISSESRSHSESSDNISSTNVSSDTPSDNSADSSVSSKVKKFIDDYDVFYKVNYLDKFEELVEKFTDDYKVDPESFTHAMVEQFENEIQQLKTGFEVKKEKWLENHNATDIEMEMTPEEQEYYVNILNSWADIQQDLSDRFDEIAEKVEEAAASSRPGFAPGDLEGLTVIDAINQAKYVFDAFVDSVSELLDEAIYLANYDPEELTEEYAEEIMAEIDELQVECIAKVEPYTNYLNNYDEWQMTAEEKAAYNEFQDYIVAKGSSIMDMLNELVAIMSE